MRFIALITVILVFASCSSLKPAVNKQPEAGANQRNTSSPQFIEHITINDNGEVTVDFEMPFQKCLG